MAKQNGRPITPVEDRLCCSIKVRMSIDDYYNLLSKSEKLGISISAYARKILSKGKVIAPYSAEELDLMRKLAGEANNLNQIAKHLNSGAKQYGLEACVAVEKIKNIINDSKKH